MVCSGGRPEAEELVILSQSQTQTSTQSSSEINLVSSSSDSQPESHSSPLPDFSPSLESQAAPRLSHSAHPRSLLALFAGSQGQPPSAPPFGEPFGADTPPQAPLSSLPAAAAGLPSPSAAAPMSDIRQVPCLRLGLHDPRPSSGPAGVTSPGSGASGPSARRVEAPATPQSAGKRSREDTCAAPGEADGTPFAARMSRVRLCSESPGPRPGAGRPGPAAGAAAEPADVDASAGVGRDQFESPQSMAASLQRIQGQTMPLRLQGRTSQSPEAMQISQATTQAPTQAPTQAYPRGPGVQQGGSAGRTAAGGGYQRMAGDMVDLTQAYPSGGTSRGRDDPSAAATQRFPMPGAERDGRAGPARVPGSFPDEAAELGSPLDEGLGGDAGGAAVQEGPGLGLGEGLGGEEEVLRRIWNQLDSGEIHNGVSFAERGEERAASPVRRSNRYPEMIPSYFFSAAFTGGRAAMDGRFGQYNECPGGLCFRADECEHEAWCIDAVDHRPSSSAWSGPSSASRQVCLHGQVSSSFHTSHFLLHSTVASTPTFTQVSVICHKSKPFNSSFFLLLFFL